MSKKLPNIGLNSWLSGIFDVKNIALEPMTGDAGFRSYFRFFHDGRPLIAVDAPPKYSNNQAFSILQQALSAKGINVPEIVAMDLELGYFCLSDFGQVLLADVLSNENMAVYYRQAIDLLPLIATAYTEKTHVKNDTVLVSNYELAVYDRVFVEMELAIFSEWLLDKHLGIELSTKEKTQLKQCFDYLIENVLSQPQVTMHRDFHSRNIMVLDNKQLGVIDFQDAVLGPITYDIVSLLRDCYTRWPDEQIAPLVEYFCQLISSKLSLPTFSSEQWHLWFDLMGIQRHLKASGIFARLFYRDGKNGYLKDIPLTLSYIEDISAKYPELIFLHQLIHDRVIPTMKNINKNDSKNTEINN